MANMEAHVQNVENTSGMPDSAVEAMTVACEIFAEALDQCDMPEYGRVTMGFNQTSHDVVLQYTKNAEGDGYDAKAELVKKGEGNDVKVNTDPF